MCVIVVCPSSKHRAHTSNLRALLLKMPRMEIQITQLSCYFKLKIPQIIVHRKKNLDVLYNRVRTGMSPFWSNNSSMSLDFSHDKLY